MKKWILSTFIAVSAVTLFSGCLNLQLGGGTTSKPQTPSLGQQLVDLQHAKDAGAITQAQYENQKAKLLGGK
jgi:hypothetical protein